MAFLRTLSCAALLAAGPALAKPTLLEKLQAQAPEADARVLALALQARECALASAPAARRLAVIDYSRPSTEPRLWVFDLAHQRLLFEEWVAHGRNSGENRTEHFSNRDGSFMSSLGAFTAQETYMGGNGYSLRLAGLEPGWSPLSLTPEQTWRSALALTPPAAFFIAMISMSQLQRERMVRICIAAAIIGMLLGAAQLASGGLELRSFQLPPSPPRC